ADGRNKLALSSGWRAAGPCWLVCRRPMTPGGVRSSAAWSPASEFLTFLLGAGMARGRRSDGIPCDGRRPDGTLVRDSANAWALKVKSLINFRTTFGCRKL